MLDRYEIQNIEQLRAISDMLRLRILDLLRERPMTVTQVGERLSSTSEKEHYAPAKIHYHVRELEKVGLLRLVETREKGGILEKYYQPVARVINVPSSLLRSIPPDEVSTVVSTIFDQAKDGFQSALHQSLEQKINLPHIEINIFHLYMTSEELRQVYRQIDTLLAPYEIYRGLPGEQEIESLLVAYPQEYRTPTPSSDDRVVHAESADQKAQEVLAKKDWTVGFITYSKADLEQVVAEGRQLHISVIGTCHIARDVSADLADQAIAKLSLVGKLEAPKTVYELLMRKRV